ncbi:DNA ligase 4 [Geosmithia morbida]|uniref:DNA ligase 4 n=1 Tax=Geosmithia morbida TaxID=1094350 RepID=A0A9P4YQZ2_9HYPO|nr:DNA ligase 4 [Geosmithia morbida]KAF4120445.1 DNA ligase 4 [Geosmithia morbida]
MPFPFDIVCELLEESYRLGVARKPNYTVVEGWFARNATRVAAHDTDLAALLSTLLPGKRPDRMYSIQTPALELIVGRGLGLGASRKKEISRHREPGSGVDLADCVEGILSITPNQLHIDSRVTVEEVDQLLHGLACRIKWSSPAIRASKTPLAQRDRGDLESMYRRLTAREAKWLTRLVLKSYAPLVFDENLILRSCDPSLPMLLRIRQDFTSAVAVAQDIRSRLLLSTTAADGGAGATTAWKKLLPGVMPRVGIKVGRQHWTQARSIKHCLALGEGRMSVEQKVDGEYCQIHVDLSKGDDCVQIFSKSGKDSTEDRRRLHRTIKESLRLGQPDCRISKTCIVEGELAVYSDSERKILPFHKIRNHVTRRGMFLNTAEDSPPRPHEHLVIIYFDVLLVDDVSFLGVRHSERCKALAGLVRTEPGWAEVVQREIIDFDHGLAASTLRKAFAKVIVSRGEGLVLKPDDPYFDLTQLDPPRSGRCIKIKKEYIGSFGEVGDLAAVGAGYDATTAKQYKVPNLKWTHFYIGCLNNKQEVQQWGAIQDFTVTNVVELNEMQLKSVMQFGNPMPMARDDLSSSTSIKLTIVPAIETNHRMTVVFANPLVFDMRCFSFDKPGNVGFWTLRFPAVSKVHFDRDVIDTIPFGQLQELAEFATTAPEHPDSQQNLQWVAKLEGADARGFAVDARSQTASTATTVPSPSPRNREMTATRSLSSSRLSQSADGESDSNSAQPAHRWQRPQIEPSVSSQCLVSSSSASELLVISTDQPRKRERPVLSPPQVRKRHRDSQNQLPGPVMRAPLADATANSSQGPTEPRPKRDVSRELAIQTQDKFSGRLVTTATEPEPTVSCSSLESEDISVFLPVSSVEICSSAPLSTSSDSPRRSCAHAGANCQFAKTSVFLAPHLGTAPSEMADLLGLHGVESRFAELEDGSWTAEGSALLLVDSVKHAAETEALIRRMMNTASRKTTSTADGGHYISVYDWRVLKNITTLEDETVTRKYYEGFKDPWRRWYCGLI